MRPAKAVARRLVLKLRQVVRGESGQAGRQSQQRCACGWVPGHARHGQRAEARGPKCLTEGGHESGQLVT
eukprot:168049-Chlamydomonas_euryale.AAC.1